MKNYKIIIANSVEDFEKLLNEASAEGFQIVGNHAVTVFEKGLMYSVVVAKIE